MQLSTLINSFRFTYIFLITTSVITIIEALRSPIPQVRHILNLETCISLIAIFFYGSFISEIEKSEKEKEKENDNDNTKERSIEDLPLEKINSLRYTDWFITTPFMLLALCMLLGYENKVMVKFVPYLLVLCSNFFMLFFGYIGEIGTLDKFFSNLIGYIFFHITYAMIWIQFMRGSKVSFQSKFIFWLYYGIWTIYGIFYLMDETHKNFGYNILDLISKALLGICFWLYLTKSIVF